MSSANGTPSFAKKKPFVSYTLQTSSGGIRRKICKTLHTKREVLDDNTTIKSIVGQLCWCVCIVTRGIVLTDDREPATG
jgi:hypothetical protein